VTFQRKRGLVVLDQLRTVDRRRLVRRLGEIDPVTRDRVLAVLIEMFAS
jgi:mRNA interferase MazF